MHFVRSGRVQQLEQAIGNFVRSPANRDDDARVGAPFGCVLAVQFLEIPAVVRYYTQTSVHGIRKLLIVWLAQLT